MKKYKIFTLEASKQKLNIQNSLILKSQLKQIKGGFIVEEDAEGI